MARCLILLISYLIAFLPNLTDSVGLERHAVSTMATEAVDKENKAYSSLKSRRLTPPENFGLSPMAIQSVLGQPLEIVISMYMEGISDFSMKTMDFRLDAYFQQKWKDTRLKHNGTERLMINQRSLLESIWLPDIYFANSRSSGFHDLMTRDFLLYIDSDGSMLFDCRVSVTVLCGMDFYKWPLDSQFCDIRIMSYAHDDKKLVLKWDTVDPPLLTDSRIQLQLPDVDLLRVQTGICNGTFTLGNWSCMTAEFCVSRRVMHYVLQCYFPTTILVLTSWSSFWLDVESVPARVGLSITTLLTLMTQANAARLQLPEVSKMKAIDVWMGTCIVFVFGALIEFTVANYAQRMEEKRGTEPEQQKWAVWAKVRNWMLTCLETKESKESMGLSAMFSGNDLLLNIPLDQAKRKATSYPIAIQRSTKRSKEQRARDWLNRQLAQQRKTLGIKAAQRIDQKARRIFPCSFFVFTVAYWVYYIWFA